jgi:hypothetical protein
MIRVYTASKISTAALWRELDRSWPHVHFHARWLKHNFKGTTDRQEYARAFWREDEIDVQCADTLIVYAKEGEHLQGALVEVGMAIAFGVPVIAVGDHPDYSTWQFHPLVTRVADLKAAYEVLCEIDKKLGLHQPR